MGAAILVIEDTPESLRLMSYLLAAYGHAVTTAVTGEQGVELARAARPDMILMDLQLPGIDGFEALAALRSIADLDGVPVVAVTSFAMVGDRDRALAAGFDHYLTKPIDPETFPDEINARLPAELRGYLPEQPGVPPTPAPSTTFTLPETNGHPAVDILVLDDSLINQTLLRSMLEPHGYRIRTASTVEAAIAAAEEKCPDLVLSDIHVGQQTGADLLSHLRAMPARTVVPFAFITATNDWQDPGLGDGKARIIQRPIDPTALLDEVNALLSSRAGD
ncbi:MAG: two-component system, cell cycle response regulator [Actinoplanes sp.]|jgi:two-component system cell cycle response regulator|nr:two-component system, cell cycle response regulator [Actinoplanes sp.]